LLALGLVGAVFFMRRNTCTACPSLGTRLGQTWEPNRPVSTIGSIRAKASVSDCRLRMEPLTSAVGLPLRRRIPIHFQSRDFRSNDLSVTLSSRSEAASTGYWPIQSAIGLRTHLSPTFQPTSTLSCPGGLAPSRSKAA